MSPLPHGPLTRTPPPSCAPKPFLWTVKPFHHLGDLGWFEGRRASLINGIIIEEGMMTPPHAVAIALDRQEKATENGLDVNYSAVQYVTNQLGLQVCAIARLTDLLQYLAMQHSGEHRSADHAAVLAYRDRYGVD